MTNYKDKAANLMNEIILYRPSVRVPGFNNIINILLIISSIYTLILAYYARLSIIERKNRKEEKIRQANALEFRLYSIEQKLKVAESDISLLSNLYPEMYERTVTIGNSSATWRIPSIYYSDIVILQYNIVDIATNTVIKRSQAEYSCLNVVSYLNPNTEIVIPAGATLVVVKAVRISRWYNNIDIPVDITADAKANLEMKARR